jgi:preprotein translocase subunit SecF
VAKFVGGTANESERTALKTEIDGRASWTWEDDVGCHGLFWMNQAAVTVKTTATHQLRDAAIPAIVIAIMVVLFLMSGRGRWLIAAAAVVDGDGGGVVW